jgi:hypothetical protein
VVNTADLTTRLYIPTRCMACESVAELWVEVAELLTICHARFDGSKTRGVLIKSSCGDHMLTAGRLGCATASDP